MEVKVCRTSCQHIFFSCMSGCEYCLNRYIEFGVSVDSTCREESNHTPLHVAAIYNRVQIIKILLKNNASINERCDEDYTPLHYAAAYNKETVIALLDGGADINAKDFYDSTPIMVAIDLYRESRRDSTLEVIKTLLERGANQEGIDKEYFCTNLEQLFESVEGIYIKEPDM